ncbi:MAG: peptidoglycan-binding protein [Treponema sp.]|nr:peptidoglycan-binding protein [Treponema sp.]
MYCGRIIDMIYQYSGSDDGDNSMPLLNQLEVWLHTLFCEECARQASHLEKTRSVLREDFFPLSPGTENQESWSSLEDSIMTRVENEQSDDLYASPGGISTRGWIITGLIIMVSLITAFFGFDFQNIARESGTSFMLPMGITIGIILTTYGALFIGSHLKELSERFGL